MRRLNQGDKIEIHGDVLLKGMDLGVYWVDFITHVSGVPVYGFRKFRGRSIWSQQLANSIDHWIGHRIRILAKAV